MGAKLKATFSVKNFERFQHYKDRSPPWIKLYNELLDDYDFGLLPDASKMHLVAIWLLASRSDNKIPLDPVWIASKISATSPVDLTILRTAGFIEYNQDCSNVLALCEHVARPEERTSLAEVEGEISSEKSDASPIPSKPVRKPYPKEFEDFWKGYPTDALMSKAKAFERWTRLSPTDRAAAVSSLPAFRAHCTKDSTYRPVHAERYLAQRRFDGFIEAAKAMEPDPLLRQIWDGKAAALVDAIGAAKFAAWFSDTEWQDGPPHRLRVSKPFAAKWIAEHYAADLTRLYGEVRIEVAA